MAPRCDAEDDPDVLMRISKPGWCVIRVGITEDHIDKSIYLEDVIPDDAGYGKREDHRQIKGGLEELRSLEVLIDEVREYYAERCGYCAKPEQPESVIAECNLEICVQGEDLGVVLKTDPVNVV